MTESREHKTATFSGTLHRHLCLYEMQGTQSRVLQISPCCSSSEVQNYNFYHTFFTTSLRFLICLHSWGTPEGTRMLHTCTTLSGFSPAKPVLKAPTLAGATFPCNTGNKTKRERGKSFKPFSGKPFFSFHRRMSNQSIQERSEEKGGKIPNVVHGSCEHLTALTC